MQEGMDMKGQLTLIAVDREGRTIFQRTHRNRIVKAGRQLVAQLFGGVTAGTPPSKVTHMAVGTGASAETDDQTDLQAPRLPRKPITSVTYADVIDSGVKRVKATLQVVFDYADANGPTPLREAGVFTAATAGTMYNRVVFDAVTKNDTFKLTLLWDVLF